MSVEVDEVDECGLLLIVADRLGKKDDKWFGSGPIGDASSNDRFGDVIGDAKVFGVRAASESSPDRRDEDEDETAEGRSGAL